MSQGKLQVGLPISTRFVAGPNADSHVCSAGPERSEGVEANVESAQGWSLRQPWGDKQTGVSTLKAFATWA